MKVDLAPWLESMREINARTTAQMMKLGRALRVNDTDVTLCYAFGDRGGACPDPSAAGDGSLLRIVRAREALPFGFTGEGPGYATR